MTPIRARRGARAGRKPKGGGAISVQVWLKRALWTALAGGAVFFFVLATFVLVNAVSLHARMQASAADERRTLAQIHVETLRATLEAFHSEHGRYPSEDEGLAVLEPFLRLEIPEDPWGRPYLYRGPERIGGPTIVSMGADGKPGGEGAAEDVSSGALADAAI